MTSISVTPERLDVELEEGSGLPPRLFEVKGKDGEGIDVEVEASEPWLEVAIDEARGGFVVAIPAEIEGETLPLGTHRASLFVTDVASYRSVRIPVSVVVKAIQAEEVIEDPVYSADAPRATEMADVEAPAPSTRSKKTKGKKAKRAATQGDKQLDNEQWVRNVFHPSESLFIGKVFEMLVPAALRVKIDQLQASRALPVLDPRFRQDPATSPLPIARTFGWAARSLGLACPPLYVRNDMPGGLVAVPANPPASIAGSTVLRGLSTSELAFLVGRHLAVYRGEHYMRTLFPTVLELKVVLHAGIQIAEPAFVPPREIAQPVRATSALLAPYVEPVRAEGLRMVVRKLTETGASTDVTLWYRSAKITRARAGFILCGDLDVARKILFAEGMTPDGLAPHEMMGELVAYSRSEQYAALRDALGAT